MCGSDDFLVYEVNQNSLKKIMFTIKSVLGNYARAILNTYAIFI